MTDLPAPDGAAMLADLRALLLDTAREVYAAHHGREAADALTPDELAAAAANLPAAARSLAETNARGWSEVAAWQPRAVAAEGLRDAAVAASYDHNRDVIRTTAERDTMREAAARAKAEAARLAGELAIARLRPTRADVLATLRTVVQNFNSNRGAAPFYTDDVRSACAVAFAQLAAACGWEPLTESEARL